MNQIKHPDSILQKHICGISVHAFRFHMSDCLQKSLKELICYHFVHTGENLY